MLQPARARGPLPANPMAGSSPCGPPPNSRARISRSELSSSEPALLDRGRMHPPRAARSGKETKAACGARPCGLHQPAARSAMHESAENRLRRPLADQCRRARNSWCRGRYLCSSGGTHVQKIKQLAGIYNLCALPMIGKMLLVTRHEVVGLRSFSAFKETVVRLVGGNGNTNGRCNKNRRVTTQAQEILNQVRLKLELGAP